MARRQQEKSQQTQDELLETAVKLFGSKGFFATTVSEITAMAGYAKGSFYRHWASKDELMLCIIERKMHNYRLQRDKQLAKAKNLQETLEVIWDFLESIVADKNWARVFLEFAIYASRNEQLKAKLNEPEYRLSSNLFAKLVHKFIATDYPPEKLGALNTALFEGFLIHNILDTGILNNNDVKTAAIHLALHKCSN